MHSLELEGFIGFISAFTSLSFISTLCEKDLIDLEAKFSDEQNKTQNDAPSLYLLLTPELEGMLTSS